MNYNDEITYFKKALKEYRYNRELTQYGAGKMCGLGSNTGFKQIETNGNPSLYTLLMITKGLDLKIEIKDGKLFIID